VSKCCAYIGVFLFFCLVVCMSVVCGASAILILFFLLMVWQICASFVGLFFVVCLYVFRFMIIFGCVIIVFFVFLVYIC